MTTMEFLALSAVFVLVACAAGIGALIGIIAQSGPGTHVRTHTSSELTRRPRT
ncbi:hypothetical protein [Gordonia oryzae]|uniref:hypothetical protein n=1 Tax=Gordonia oryzae TaxID=2487349 RepID=UPI0016092F3A|nr:hypothetical protein [Gordonia oryzae]